MWIGSVELISEFCVCGGGMDALSILQEKYSPFPYGLGLHEAGSAQLPRALCVCTLTALMSMAGFSELPTQASQPVAAKFWHSPRSGRVLQTISVGQGYQAAPLCSPQNKGNFNWIIILIVLMKKEEKCPALSCSSGLSLVFLSINLGVSVVSLTHFSCYSLSSFSELVPHLHSVINTKYWDSIFEITAWTLW